MSISAGDAAKQLASDLATLTGKTADELRGFAEQWGPRYAKWALQLADATAHGDEEAAERLRDDLVEIHLAAIEEAGIAGVQLQGGVEGGMMTLLDTFAKRLI